MEVIRNLDNDNYYTEYYFDDYKYIDATLTDEEIKEIDEFIMEWKDKMPDQNEVDVCMGTEFLKSLPKDISWLENYSL